MSQDAKKETQQILREMRRRGYTVEQAKRGGHWTVSDPDSGVQVTVAGSPSDARQRSHVRADMKRFFGEDLLAKPQRRKKGTSDDWALNRLRDRTVTQMTRGASEADMARMAICANEDKKIGGWTSFNAASVGISSFLKGGRLMKENHDTLAAAIGKLESSAEPKIFERHLNEAAERLGQKRLRAHRKPEQPVLEVALEPGDKEAVEDVLESEPDSSSTSIPQDLTVTIRIEIDPATRSWLVNMLAGIKVFNDD